MTSENHWVRIGLMSLKPAGQHHNTWMCTLEQALNSHCTAALGSCFCHEGVKPRKPGEQGGRCMHQNAQAISQKPSLLPLGHPLVEEPGTCGGLFRFYKKWRPSLGWKGLTAVKIGTQGLQVSKRHPAGGRDRWPYLLTPWSVIRALRPKLGWTTPCPPLFHCFVMHIEC